MRTTSRTAAQVLCATTRSVMTASATGILHNELHVGRIIWNKQNYRKNLETARRTACLNDKSDWVVTEVPAVRIVSDELWVRVEERQLTTLENFSRTTTNRLNRTHRPGYLLKCAECGGSHAIMAKKRYGQGYAYRLCARAYGQAPSPSSRPPRHHAQQRCRRGTA